jgi:hypothetical protein
MAMIKKNNNRRAVPNEPKVAVRGVELDETGYASLLDQIAKKRVRGEKFGVGQASSIILAKALEQGITI